MQEFSIAFGRVSRAAIAANPELKSYVTDLLNRAYYNLHSTSFSVADPQWANAISATALQLCLDERGRNMTPRESVQMLENLIRISEEHLRESRRHAAMACNVFYLKETALDSSIHTSTEATYHAATTQILGTKLAHTGRIQVPDPKDPID